MFAWLKQIFDRSDDPVYSCDLYRDKDARMWMARYAAFRSARCSPNTDGRRTCGR